MFLLWQKSLSATPAARDGSQPPGALAAEAADVCRVGAESAAIPQSWERAQPVPPVPLPAVLWLCVGWR